MRKGPHALDIRLGHEDQGLVWGDAERLRQLLLNLTDNAIKYTPTGGTITLSLTNEEQWVKVAVSDTGIGIHAESQQQIFQRFYRTDKARSREEGGSGLGLSIVQWIAQAHEGRVTVESEPQKGSTFTLWLPEYNRERQNGEPTA
ncbi:MAG: ATP-binding protein [Caldilineaceae bacterium]|nr:ATP-binding protein [Caldilineaceae bacterium]